MRLFLLLPSNAPGGAPERKDLGELSEPRDDGGDHLLRDDEGGAGEPHARYTEDAFRQVRLTQYLLIFHGGSAPI